VGQKVDYYAFPEVEVGGGEPVEAILSKIESAAAPVIENLLAAPDAALEGQDRADLLYFMAFFAIRVPYFRNMIETFMAEIAKDIFQLSASHPDYFERTLPEAFKDKEELIPEKVEELREWILDESNYRIESSPKLSIIAGFDAATEDIYPIFDRMRWAVVRTSDDLRFITSDTPVSWVDPTSRPPFALGLAAKNVEVTSPVGSTACVCGTPEGPTGSIRAWGRAVEQFNIRRVIYSDRYVFADSEARARTALTIRERIEKAQQP
jgi:hypothetical protein